MEGKVIKIGTSVGQHFSCYQKEVRKMLQPQWTAVAERVCTSPYGSYNSVFEFAMPITS